MPVTPLSWDGEVLAALQPMLAARAAVETPPVGDVFTRRANFEALFGALSALIAAGADADVSVSHAHAVSADGTEVALRLFRPHGAAEGSLWLWIHGGGMIMGTLDQYELILTGIAAAAQVTILAPEYRLAPEHPHPAPVEDCYAALQWASDHAPELGVDATRIGIAGDSGGGGIAAGLALLARDRKGPPIAKQLLVYPMLDDRSITPDPAIVDSVTWNYDDNRTGWEALLGQPAGAHDGVPIYAVPARAEDLTGLPPTYIDVGGLDLFRDEDIDYARRLHLAGVSAELHVTPGVPHAFEILVPHTAAAQRVLQGRYRFLRSL